MESSSPNKPLFLSLSEEEFTASLKAHSKRKDRSEDTLIDVHWPELHLRLGSTCEIPERAEPSRQTKDACDDPFTPRPDLTNTSQIEVVYIGNSMLERLKTTGASTSLAQLAREGTAWNAGCGGDKTENVNYRLCEERFGMYEPLKSFGSVKLWVVVSGTNNLRPKKPFRNADVEAYRSLLEACLRIAPNSRIVACDMFYRKDIADAIVDESNGMVKEVVQQINQDISGHLGRGSDSLVDGPIQWVESRASIGKEDLVDHVHLTEEGYAKWDRILWPYIRGHIREFEQAADASQK